MKVYKGYLIETYPDNLRTPDGFGGYITSQRWAVRTIKADTGDVLVYPLGSDEESVMRALDILVDITGFERKRQTLISWIAFQEDEVKDQTDKVEEETEKLKELVAWLNLKKNELAELEAANVKES